MFGAVSPAGCGCKRSVLTRADGVGGKEAAAGKRFELFEHPGPIIRCMRCPLTPGSTTMCPYELHKNTTEAPGWPRPRGPFRQWSTARSLSTLSGAPDHTVAERYRRWCVAPAVEGATRFAVYLAALDQEQAAAGVHAEVINELEPRLPDSDPDQSFEPRSQSG